ncbi:SET domain-containing protein [Phytophthora infestans]|nr:SET domain-containing protein [Phytophthora infestans]
MVNRDGAGTGVRATADICAGSILSEYTGRLTTEDLENSKGPRNKYALGLQLKSTRRKSVFIDAARCGNITRMMNHSCDATCQFVEVRNRRQVKVVVVAKRRIGEGEDVTVDYKSDLWFTCCCGSRCCVAGQVSQKMRQFT